MKKDFIFLFLISFLVLFFGFILSNTAAIAIHCIFVGFGSFFTAVLKLPYAVYALFSFIISAVFTIFIYSKTKPK